MSKVRVTLLLYLTLDQVQSLFFHSYFSWCVFSHPPFLRLIILQVILLRFLLFHLSFFVSLSLSLYVYVTYNNIPWYIPLSLDSNYCQLLTLYYLCTRSISLSSSFLFSARVSLSNVFKYDLLLNHVNKRQPDIWYERKILFPWKAHMEISLAGGGLQTITIFYSWELYQTTPVTIYPLFYLRYINVRNWGDKGDAIKRILFLSRIQESRQRIHWIQPDLPSPLCFLTSLGYQMLGVAPDQSISVLQY